MLIEKNIYNKINVDIHQIYVSPISVCFINTDQ